MTRPSAMTAEDVLRQTQGKVLLINPPVIDSRYSWIKWNQPLDLLKLGTRLCVEHECEVKLYDFMLPATAGTVPRRQFQAEGELPPGEPTRWLFGQLWADFDAFLDSLLGERWVPDIVWITTLTSFWWQTVPLVANRIKNKLKHVRVAVSGNYPILETTHALRYCPNIDLVVTSRASVTKWPADFMLYGGRKPSFCALDLDAPDVIGEIAEALRREIHHFAFFNADIFDGFPTRLRPVLEEVVKREWELEFHGICGAEIQHFPLGNARLLASAHLKELHFEPAYRENGTIDEMLYRAVMKDCEQSQLVSKRGSGWESERFSAFLWIGRPDDKLDLLVWNALKALQLVGMVIPKPYSPLPGSETHRRLIAECDDLEPEDISPHRLPYSRLNGISRKEYEDYYRLTAFLNSKVRGHTFDFLGDTYLARVLRESLEGRRWAP
jgi:hypothetical protein